ncbi:MAG TPA: cytochrome c [Stellaceae bacterium]|nr:cytochrome c [Stellaceae bacterium]
MKNLAYRGMLAAGIAAFVAAGTMSVFAQQSDKLAAIKTRQDFMKAQGADVKTITDYTKGNADQAAAQKAADDLVARQPKIDGLFVPGTSAADFPGKTNAKPEIWTEKDKVAAIRSALGTAEQKLAADLKTGDKQTVGDDLADLGKTGCGACHNAYRLPLKRS